MALSLSIRLIGGSIGYAIYFNISSEMLTKALPERVGEAVVAAGLPAGDATQFVGIILTTPMAASTAPGASPAIFAAATRGSQDPYVYALSYVWYTSIAFGVVAIGAAVGLGNNRRFFTNRNCGENQDLID